MPSPIALVSHAPLADLERLVDRANAYAAGGRARSTHRVYLSAFDTFETWCASKGLAALPSTPGTVAVYIAELADRGRAVSTIEVTLAAIAYKHRSKGLAWPRADQTIGEVMSGIRRVLGDAPRTRKAALEIDDLRQLVAVLGEDTCGLRDRALLLVGWLGAFRRSELVSLDVAHLAETPAGLIVTLRRSKGDQEGKGLAKPLPHASEAALCPVRALRAWLTAARITDGPIFRAIDERGRVDRARLCDKSVLRIVQRTAERAGLAADKLGGHSLRAGFCTTAARRGKSLEAIMRQTGHKDERVARDYIRLATIFDDSAVTGLL